MTDMWYAHEQRTRVNVFLWRKQQGDVRKILGIAALRLP
jgi:hypothetical protein